MSKDAVIFDLDGTLVDSIGFHLEIHKKIFETIGVRLSDRYFSQKCNGSEPKEFYRRILEDSGKDIRYLPRLWGEMQKEKKRRGLSSIRAYPGVEGVLKTLKRKKKKLVVASSSKYGYAKKILDNNKMSRYFDQIVGSDDFNKSKPDPGIFLKAWKITEEAKRNCVIVEDSINGLTAAKRAGIDSIYVLTTDNIENMPSYARIAERHSDIPKIIDMMS